MFQRTESPILRLARDPLTRLQLDHANAKRSTYYDWQASAVRKQDAPVRAGRRGMLTSAPRFAHSHRFKRCWIEGYIRPWLKSLWHLSIDFWISTGQRGTERFRGVHGRWVLKYAKLAAKVIFLD